MNRYKSLVVLTHLTHVTTVNTASAKTNGELLTRTLRLATAHRTHQPEREAVGQSPDAVTGRGPGRAPSPLSYTTYQLSIVQCTGYAYGRVGHDQSVLHGYPLALITHREQVANRNLSHMSRQKQVPCPRRDSYSSNRRPLRDSLFGIGLAMQKGKLICVSGWFVCHLYGA